MSIPDLRPLLSMRCAGLKHGKEPVFSVRSLPENLPAESFFRQEFKNNNLIPISEDEEVETYSPVHVGTLGKGFPGTNSHGGNNVCL